MSKIAIGAEKSLNFAKSASFASGHAARVRRCGYPGDTSGRQKIILALFLLVERNNAAGKLPDDLQNGLYAVVAVFEIGIVAAVNKVGHHHSVLAINAVIGIMAFDYMGNFRFEKGDEAAASVSLEKDLYKLLVGDESVGQLADKPPRVAEDRLGMSDRINGGFHHVAFKRF